VIFSGIADLHFLSTRFLEGDWDESSHWRKYHSSFDFSGGGFSGQQSVGDNGARWHTPFYRILQYPFKKMDEKFSQFEGIDRTSS